MMRLVDFRNAETTLRNGWRTKRKEKSGARRATSWFGSGNFPERKKRHTKAFKKAERNKFTFHSEVHVDGTGLDAKGLSQLVDPGRGASFTQHAVGKVPLRDV